MDPKEMLWRADRMLGGAEAMATEAALMLDAMDPTNDDLNHVANLLHKAARLVDDASSKRRRAASEVP